MLITIISFILVLSILVLVHELGHFLTAKKMGVKVEEFGFGFPPRLFGKKIGETLYSINALPIGGFVKLYGEDEAGGGRVSPPGKVLLGGDRLEHSGSHGSSQVNKELKRAFFVRPAWQRFTIVVAGVVMNFLLGALILSYLFAAVGMPEPGNNVIIAGIAKNSPADRAGLKQGDIVIAINNQPIQDTQTLIKFTKKHLGQPVDLKIKDKRLKIKDIILIPRVRYPANEGAIGIAIGQNIINKKYPWYQAPIIGLRESASQVWEILKGLWGIVTQLIYRHTVPQGFAGPVGIAQITGQFVQMGIYPLLALVASLSLNLAVLNVLPIPALDGGRLFFIFIEMITGKKVHSKFEAYAHTVGMAVLLTLVVLITYRDITRLIAGKSILP